MTTPICPKCGSVRVRPAAKRRRRCAEPGCGHEGKAEDFLRGGPDTGQRRNPNQQWRDPAALSMDGPGKG